MKKCEWCKKKIPNTTPHVHWYTARPHNYCVECYTQNRSQIWQKHFPYHKEQ